MLKSHTFSPQYASPVTFLKIPHIVVCSWRVLCAVVRFGQTTDDGNLWSLGIYGISAFAFSAHLFNYN